jgi:hypothetical protein
MDKIFVNIIIIPMLRYFQLLYGYFSLIKIISPYIIYGYLKLLLAFFGYFSLFHFKLFLAIGIFLVILCYFWIL